MGFIYKGLKAKLEKHTVTEQELLDSLEQLRKANPKISAVERPAQLGDELILDYAGFCDGEQFQGGTAEYQMLTLGSGRFIPGFEEQLVGATPESEVTVTVKFPEEYHAPELAGKEAQFKCKIHQVRASEEYQLDDTFAREVGHCETLEEMKEKVRENLQQYANERSEMELQNGLLHQAVESYPATEPTENELQEAIDEQMKALEGQLQQQGATLDMYCQFMKTTEEALREQAIPAAKRNIQANAAIAKIIELEGLTASEEELREAMEVVCTQNHMTYEQMKPYITEEFTEAVRRSVLTGKVMELLRNSAIIE